MLTRAPLPYIGDTEKVNIFNFPCSVVLPDCRPEWGGGENSKVSQLKSVKIWNSVVSS